MLFSFAASSALAAASDLAILHNGFSIKHERREVLGMVTRLYTGVSNSSYVDVVTSDIERFEKDESISVAPDPGTPMAVPPAAGPTPNAVSVSQPVNLDQVVKDASGKHLIDPDFISSVIRAESGFKTRAVSPKGAQGLMQLMPGTAASLGVGNAFDPTANVDGGTRYLRWLLEKYNYDVPKALAAYNAGPRRVDQYHGVPPYLETRAYVARIIRDFNRKKLAEQKAAAVSRKASSRATSSARTSQASGSTPSSGGSASASR